MRQLGILLVLVFLSLGSVYGEEEVQQNVEETKIPLSFLIFPGSNDLQTEFGFEVVEALHLKRVRCEIDNRKEELKFTDKQDNAMKYFRQTKQAMSFPEFEELASENKKDLETNFKKAFREMEVSHLRKLSRMQVDCDRVAQRYMEERLRRVMNYATALLRDDVSRFTKFTSDMTEYQGQLQRGLGECINFVDTNRKSEHFERAGLSFDLCYGNEVVTLIKFVTNFTRLTEDLMRKMYKDQNAKIELIKSPKKPPEESPTKEQPPTTEKIENEKPTKAPITEGPDQEAGDDGDASGSGSGSGSGPEDDKSPFKEKSGKPITREKPPHEKPSQTPPTKRPPSNHAKTEPTKPSKTNTNNKEEKPTSKSNLDAAQDFFNSLEPGPVIFDPTKLEDGTSTPPPENKPLSDEDKQVAENAFERVEKMQEAVERKPEERMRGESRSQLEEKDPGLSIDLDLPSVDAGVDVQIGPNGVQINPHSGGEQEIVFDEVIPTTVPTHNDQHHQHSFKIQFLIYFFATLGVLLSIALITLLVILVKLRGAKPASYSKDSPLLSEQEKIAVMKKSGYVNPTYQFFDEVKDV